MSNNQPIMCSSWDQDKQLFFTQISGIVGFDDVKTWEEDMRRESKKIPANTTFKFLVDERNYQFENIEVHKFKRDIMPRFLAEFDFILSVLSDEEKKLLKQRVEPNKQQIRCIAIAMVHHDKEKMQNLQNEFGQENEKYLSDMEIATNWLNSK